MGYGPKWRMLPAKHAPLWAENHVVRAVKLDLVVSEIVGYVEKHWFNLRLQQPLWPSCQIVSYQGTTGDYTWFIGDISALCRDPWRYMKQRTFLNLKSSTFWTILTSRIEVEVIELVFKLLQQFLRVTSPNHFVVQSNLKNPLTDHMVYHMWLFRAMRLKGPSKVNVSYLTSIS